MNLRPAGTLVLIGIGVALLLFSHGSLVGPAMWFGRPNPLMIVALSALIFCVIYFGTLKLWHLMTGDRLQKPFPAILALWLGIKLTVDCARMLRWWWW